MLTTLRLRTALQHRPARALLRRDTASFCSNSSSTSAATVAVDDAAATRAARRAARAKPRAIEGTVPYYERHFVVVDTHGRAEDWPKKLEASDHIIATYAKTLDAIEQLRGSDAKSSPLRITAAIAYTRDHSSAVTCQSKAAAATIAHDVLVFPDNVRVHDVSESQIEAFVREGVHTTTHFASALDKLNLRYSPVERGFHLFACAHANRDFRCACAGPKLLQWLDDIAHTSDVPLHLWAASHYGGHRYAGNCVAYPSGDWFGLINAREDVARMVAALAADAPLTLVDQWRGRMGLTKIQQIQALQQHAVAVASDSS